MGDWGGRHSKKRNSRGASGGAHYLSSVHGTEVDRLNCPFYYKMGACRHGTLCSRRHNYPVVSPTVLLPHLWKGGTSDQLEEFYRDVYNTCAKEFGKVRSVDVLDNTVEHLRGNVYVSFEGEDSAVQCQKAMHGRFFDGRVVTAEFSTVCDVNSFDCDGRCRQYDRGMCKREGCNYLHVRKICRPAY